MMLIQKNNHQNEKMNNNPKNTLRIIEWQKFSLEHIKPAVLGDEAKAKKIFDELQDFARYEKNQSFLNLDNGGKSLKARNYVGLIQTKSGFSLEILPKIYDKDSKLQETKNLFIKMLKTLKNFPAKASNISNIDTSKTPLLEIFIQMFLNELISLIKKGIKSNYHSIEQNRFYLKGKLLFSQNIKYNLAHQERFYTRADEYSPDNPQNRLIKNTLESFSKIPLSAKTQNLLRECRFIFDDIPLSKNIDKDFSSSHINRSLKDYQIILSWCKIFLKKQSFSPYCGNTVAMAFLFDMNRLFEAYITHHLKLYSRESKEWNIKAQDGSKYLLDGNQCRLIPDIIATKDGNKDDKETIILDTKWKKISKQSDVETSDIHQMWAYASKHKSKKVILIYPKISAYEGFSLNFKPEILESSLTIRFIDMNKDIEVEIGEIFQEYIK